MTTKIKLTNPTDDELGAAVAEHVAKIAHLYTLMKRGLYYRVNAAGYTSRFEDAWKVTEDVANQHAYPGEDAVTKHRVKTPPYATSADAVLPLLEKAGAWAMDWCPIISNRGLAYKVWVRKKGIEALGPTFPRAACIALLRANGIEVEMVP